MYRGRSDTWSRPIPRPAAAFPAPPKSRQAKAALPPEPIAGGAEPSQGSESDCIYDGVGEEVADQVGAGRLLGHAEPQRSAVSQRDPGQLAAAAVVQADQRVPQRRAVAGAVREADDADVRVRGHRERVARRSVAD